MLKSKASIKKKFNRIFSHFYFLIESLSYPLRLKIIKQIPNLKNKKILDVCCGTGLNSLILTRQGVEVVGIDFSKNQIKLANRRKEKYPNLKLDFKVMDAENLKFKDNNFDMVTCSFGLHELGTVETLNGVIEQIKRVLKPRGRLIIADPNKPANEIISLFYYRLLSFFEPKETLKFIYNNSSLSFAKRYKLKPIQEKTYLFNLLKLWIFENEEL